MGVYLKSDMNFATLVITC